MEINFMSNQESRVNQQYKVRDSSKKSYIKNEGITNFTSPKNQNASSIESRPLMLKTHSNYNKKINEINVTSKHLTAGKENQKHKIECKQLNCQMPADLRQNKAIDQNSFFSSSFSSWKASAGFLVETIRGKLNFFRSNQDSNEIIDAITFKEDSSLLNSLQENIEKKDVNKIKTEELSIDVGCSSIRREAETIKDSNQPFVKNDNSSCCDNDDTCDKLIIKRNLDLSLDHDDQTNNTQSLKKTDAGFHSTTDNIKFFQDEVNQNCSSTSLCSPCIGSQEFTRDPSVSHQEEHLNIDLSLNYQDSDSINSKVVHNQPWSKNSSPCKHNSTESDNCTGMFSEKGQNVSSRPQLLKTPSLVLEKATPIKNLQQDLNKSSATGENQLKYSKLKEASFSNAFEMLTDHLNCEVKEVSPVNEQSKNIKSGETQNGINIWNLRNSLEHTIIKIQQPTQSFDDFEKVEAERRFSVVTEASPLSTPSSERTNFRGRSISESDDDSRAYFVTMSGRLSPRQPIIYSRKNSGVSTSPDRSSNENLAISGGNREIESNQKNIVLATATIECRKGASFSKPHCAPDIPSTKTENRNFERLTSKRNKFHLSSKRDKVTNDDKIVTQSGNWQKLAPTSKLPSSLRRLLRQNSLPISMEQKFAFTQDDIEKQSKQDSSRKESESKAHFLEPFVSSFPQRNVDLPKSSDTEPAEIDKSIETCSSQSFYESDDVFLNDDLHDCHMDYFSDNHQNTKKNIALNGDELAPLKKQSQKHIKIAHNSAIRPLGESDPTANPPSYKIKQKKKLNTKFGSATSSDASTPTSPNKSSSFSRIGFRSSKSIDMESYDSCSTHATNSRSSSTNIKNLAKFFKRSNKSRQRCDSAPTFCGYSLARDYCVDLETDRTFKEFLCNTNPTVPAVSLPSGEQLPPPSHMLPPPPLRQTSSAQLRRQVMRKQYSDSIALYYGQRQRKWRFTKQKSDSVNCPVDRATFKRQDCIDEEFDPEEINEKLSSTSSRRSSGKTDFVLPTVRELKEWRQSSEEHRVMRNANPIHLSRRTSDTTSNRPTRRVTFKQTNFDY